MQAFADGKQIQDKIEGLTGWVDTDEINLEYEGQRIKHRIKPELKSRSMIRKDILFNISFICWSAMFFNRSILSAFL